MVDAVHVRRDDEAAQNAVDLRRDADVAMVEHRGGVKQHLEDQHHHGRRTDPPSFLRQQLMVNFRFGMRCVPKSSIAA